MQEALSRLSQALGYSFSDGQLLEYALTHRSAAPHNNERLEFLGDAVLSFIVADLLYRDYRDAREGKLTRFRASLVRRESLAGVARQIGLGGFLTLGPGELKSGGRDRDSILADALEALIGALYLDSDIDTCARVVETIFERRLEEVAKGFGEKDPKTRLQELLQARHLELPEYVVTDVQGAPHQHSFTVECHIRDLDEVTRGAGASRRNAEQAAARRALTVLEACTEGDAD